MRSGPDAAVLCGPLGRLAPTTAACLAAAVVLVLALFMPKRDVDDCIRQVSLGAGLVIADNCDSVHIAKHMSNPVRYLGEPSPSRTRPVHVVVVAATAHVLSPVLVPLARALRPQMAPRARNALVFYLAALMFNAAVLALSCLAFIRLAGVRPDTVTVAGLTALVASYDISLAWFWVPHQIIMNSLAPLGAVVAFVTGMRSPFMSARSLTGLGLVAAGASLTYGYCLVWPVAFAAGILWGRLLDRDLAPRTLVKPMLPFGLAATVPILLWIMAFWAQGREVAYEAQSVGQFSWMSAAWKNGSIVGEAFLRIWVVAQKVADFLGYYGSVTVGAAIMLAALRARRRPSERIVSDPVMVGIVTTALAMLLFNYLQGYHQARLLIFPLLLAQLALARLLVLSGRGALVGPVAGLIAAYQVAAGFAGPATTLH